MSNIFFTTDYADFTDFAAHSYNYFTDSIMISTATTTDFTDFGCA